MKIIIGIGHPKTVHQFKNVINNLVNDGHEVKIVAWDKDITLYLLNLYGFKYELIGKNYKGLIRKARGMLENDLKVLKVAKKFKPDIFVSGSPYLAHVSKVVGKPSIQFWDTDHANLVHWLTCPFSDVICTPSCYKKKVNPKKHIIYNGYTELAYLHPNHFKPDPSILDDVGLSKDDKLIIIRFVSWEASHDIRQHGITDKEELVRKLEDYGRPLITSERRLNKVFEKYRITIPPEKIHDLLYYATIYIGESATMATEAAVLGTPAIYANTLRLGYTDEEEEKYGLVYNFSDPETAQKQALAKAIELLDDKNLKKEWQKKRERLLNEKIDVTKFMTEFIENYPDSLNHLQSVE
jgi:predicted glycosyltransferase